MPFAIFFNHSSLANIFLSQAISGNKMSVPAKNKSAPRPPASPVSRDYTAAVRYMSGRSGLFWVRQADSFADARAMVENELINVRSIVIALRPQS